MLSPQRKMQLDWCLASGFLFFDSALLLDCVAPQRVLAWGGPDVDRQVWWRRNVDNRQSAKSLKHRYIVPRKRKMTTFNSKLPFEVKFTNKTAIIQKYCKRFLLSHRQNSCVVLIIITQNHLKLSQDERKTKKINGYNLMKVSFEAQMKDQYAMANCNG